MICARNDDTIKANFHQMRLKDNIKSGVAIAYRELHWQSSLFLPDPIIGALGILINLVDARHGRLRGLQTNTGERCLPPENYNKRALSS